MKLQQKPNVCRQRLKSLPLLAACLLALALLLAIAPRRATADEPATNASASQPANQQTYLLIPRYQKGDRWLEISHSKSNFHSSIVGPNVIEVSESTESRSKAICQVIDADRMLGDMRAEDIRYEYAFSEIVPLDQSRKATVNEPYHARLVHLQRHVDELGQPRVEVQIEGAALTPEVEAYFKSRYASRGGVMPNRPVRVGEAWVTNEQPRIESLFGPRSSGSLEITFDSIGPDPDSHRDCAILKYTGDVVISIPSNPGKDPRDEWEKRADKFNGVHYTPVGAHGAATDYLHLNGVFYVDLETRRMTGHHYQGTIQEEQEDKGREAHIGDSLRGDIKGEMRVKPAPAPDAPDNDADGPPKLAAYHDPGHRFEISFSPTWAAHSEAGGDVIRIVPANDDTSYAILRIEDAAPNAIAKSAWNDVVMPRLRQLPFIAPEAPQEIELGGKPAMNGFYRYRASNDPNEPGKTFVASTTVTVMDGKAYSLEIVSTADRFADVAKDFATMQQTFRFTSHEPAGQSPEHTAAEQRPIDLKHLPPAVVTPPATPPAYRDAAGRFHIQDLAGFTVAAGQGDDLAVLHPKDSPAGVEVVIRTDTAQADAKAAVEHVLRRAAEMGKPFDVVYEGASGNRYVAIVSRQGARQRIEAVPAAKAGDFLVVIAKTPNLETYQKFADAFDRLLAGIAP